MSNINKKLLNEYAAQTEETKEEELRANDCCTDGDGCNCCPMSGDDQCECCGEMGCLACLSM